MIEKLSKCDLDALKGLKQGQKAPFLSVNFTNEKKNIRQQAKRYGGKVSVIESQQLTKLKPVTFTPYLIVECLEPLKP